LYRYPFTTKVDSRRISLITSATWYTRTEGCGDGEFGKSNLLSIRSHGKRMECKQLSIGASPFLLNCAGFDGLFASWRSYVAASSQQAFGLLWTKCRVVWTQRTNTCYSGSMRRNENMLTVSSNVSQCLFGLSLFRSWQKFSLFGSTQDCPLTLTWVGVPKTQKKSCKLRVPALSLLSTSADIESCSFPIFRLKST